MFSRVEDILTKNPTIPQSRVEDLLVQLMEGLPTDEHIRDLVGSPLKADTVSEMTDDTKIYIYTGSETGYTAGHWYYYNGSSWTDGGVYNSAGINTDKTLSVEDKAADGKTVGDELSSLKSDLNQLRDYVNDQLGINVDYSIPTTYHQANYSNAAGTLVFKYDSITSTLRLKKASNAGSVSSGEVSTTHAQLTIGDGIGYRVDKDHNCILTVNYENDCETGTMHLVTRFYNDAYSYNNGVHIPIPKGKGTLVVNLNELADNNNVNLDTYPNHMIRSLGWDEHTASDAEVTTVDVVGYAIADSSLSERINAIESEIDSVNGEITSLSADIDNMGDVVSGFADDIETCKDALGLDVSYTFPVTYESANYSNAAGTLVFKYDSVNETLHLRRANVSSAGEISTTNARLTIGDGIGYPVSSDTPCLFVFDYENDFPDTKAYMVVRFYNAAYTSNRGARIYVPVGQGTSKVDIVALAKAENVDLTTYGNFIIRALSNDENSTACTVDVVAYGFTSDVSIIDKVDMLANVTARMTEDIEDIHEDVMDVQSDVSTNAAEIASLKAKKTPSSTCGNIFAYEPWCAHLFLNTVTDSAENTFVPSQSLYDIEISRRLGFKVIEANTHRTSDGEFVCFHGSNNTFAIEFVASPSSTYSDAEIQATNVGTVTLDWIKTNVVYKAKYEKMRVAPPTLQEFLYACKKANMVPLINYVHIDEISIADGIMGKDNYVLYSAPKSVRSLSNAPFLTITRFQTKQALLDWIADIGTPCIWTALHPEDFTQSEWKEIIYAAHEAGAMVTMAAGYLSIQQAQDWFDAGIDFGSSGWDLNPVKTGNLANLSGDGDFSEFTITGGSVTDGSVVLQANGTITPVQTFTSAFLHGSWLDITFKGSISVAMGRFITHGGSSEMQSDVSRTVHLSTYWMNSAPTFEIKSLANGTTIESVVFKVSKM